MIVTDLFYNVHFNYMSPKGDSKFMWGITDLDLSKELKPQILSRGEFNIGDVYNFQINALNPVIADDNANTN